MCAHVRVCVRAREFVYTGAVLYLFTRWIPERALDRARLEVDCVFSQAYQIALHFKESGSF